jgi:hypothetical protein
MQKYILAGLFLLMAGHLSAQWSDYQRGYIVDKDSVKTECLVEYRSEAGIMTKPLIKGEGKKQGYEASDILGYGVGDNHYVVLKNIRLKASTAIGSWKSDYLFAKSEIKGTINLYSTVIRSMSSNGMGFNYEKVFILEKLPEMPAIQLRKGKKKQKDLLKELIEDLPEALDKLGRKKLKENELKSLIHFYNNHVQPKE